MHDFSLRLIGRLARKELREILRDRRTIVTLILMPVLVYPLLSIAFQNYFSAVEKPAMATAIRIGMPPDAENTKQFREQLERGAPAEASPEQLKFEFFESEDLEADVGSGSIDLGVKLGSLSRETAVWDMLVRADSAGGKKAFDLVQTRLLVANLRIMQRQIRRHGGPASIPIQVNLTEMAAPEPQPSSALATLVPLILVLMTITGAVYPAIDLTAGERERGTLELLMAAPVPRVGLLLGKYVAVLTVAMLTGLINLVSMTVTVLAVGLGQLIFGETGLTFGSVAAVLALLLLFAAFFSAVLLAVTSFARSFKEAQAYLIPLMLLSISPGILALMPAVRLGGLLTIAPLINVVLLTREIFDGTATLPQTLVVVVSTLIYAFTAVAVAARLFGAEAVLFNEQGKWTDWLRRPVEPRPAATLSAGLACLAVMFPLHFILGSSVSRWFEKHEVSVQIRLLASMAESLLVFVGVPLISGWLSRIDWRQGFQVRRAAATAFAGAGLLGLSLWPFAGELSAALIRNGLSTTSPQMRDAVQAMIEKWRGAPALALIAIAGLPPIVEELFFRGFLFNALLTAARPRSAIVVSALLFGAFHLLLGGTLTIDRMLTATLLGLALGWVRSTTGSVLPGMLLHAANNGFLISASLFPSAFGTLANVLTENGDHVPVKWLIAGSVGAALGVGLTWLGRSSNHFLPNPR